MLQVDNKYLTALTSPRRTFKGSALFAGTAPFTAKHTDYLKSFKIERTSENNKMFGFGIAQKLTIELLDPNGNLDPKDFAEVALSLGVNELPVLPFTPSYTIDPAETKRDEVSYTLTLTGYDLLDKANKTHVIDIDLLNQLGNDYSPEDVLDKIAQYLSRGYVIVGDAPGWGINYPDGANLDGSETLREVLDDIAEITQSIYFVNVEDCIVFKSISHENAVDTIDNSQYMELKTGKDIGLSGLAFTNELGDNLELNLGTGYVQAIHDNAFIEPRENKEELLDLFVDYVLDTYNTPIECVLRGNFLYEPGDCLRIVDKVGAPFRIFLFNDTITYDGGLSQKIQWECGDGFDGHSNATTIGEAIKQTFAKVDKVNKKVEIVASMAEGNTAAIGAIQVDTESVKANVKKIEETTIPGMANEVEQLRQEVELKVSPDQLSIEIQKELGKGVNAVETTTGFTFNEDGLTVEKSGSAIKTQITEDGMTVYKNDDAVLTADNGGVKAKDLHARTFLIIGENSRFEDYGNRTGCFWIGG